MDVENRVRAGDPAALDAVAVIKVEDQINNHTNGMVEPSSPQHPAQQSKCRRFPTIKSAHDRLLEYLQKTNNRLLSNVLDKRST
nr:hypothetical transcript [Hymenolepis microstoma]